MIFNLTLFVQMVHFAIAYVLLKHLFFVPLLQLITQKQAVQEKMELAMTQLEESLVSLKKQQNKELDLLKAHFVTNHPPLLSVDQETIIQKPIEALATKKEDAEKLYQLKEELKVLLNQKLHG